MFETSFRIRSTQVDTFGHLNNAAYLEVYEWARWEWSESEGLDPSDLIDERHIGPAIVHIDLSFFKEILINEKILVRTWFHEMDKVKAVIAQEMLKPDGTLASRVFISFVMFHLQKRKVVGIPDEMRQMFAADEEYRNQRTDLQGPA